MAYLSRPPVIAKITDLVPVADLTDPTSALNTNPDKIIGARVVVVTAGGTTKGTPPTAIKEYMATGNAPDDPWIEVAESGSGFDPAGDYTVTGAWNHQRDGESLSVSGFGSAYLGFNNRSSVNRAGFVGFSGGMADPLITLAAENGADMKIQTQGVTAGIDVETQGEFTLNDSPILSENTLTVGKGRVPTGGHTGQVLTKISDTDNDVGWLDTASSGIAGIWEVIAEGDLDGITNLDIPMTELSPYSFVKLDMQVIGASADNFLYTNWRTTASAQNNNYWSTNQSSHYIRQARSDSVSTGYNNPAMGAGANAIGKVTANICPQAGVITGTYDANHHTLPAHATWIPTTPFTCSRGGADPEFLRIMLSGNSGAVAPLAMQIGSKYRLYGERIPPAIVRTYVIGFGDSLTDRSNGNGSGLGKTPEQATYSTDGYIGGMLGATESDGVYLLDYGVGGERSDQILTRVSTVIANTYGAKVAVLTVGTNDATEHGGVPFVKANYKANIQSIVDQLLTAGIKPIFVPVTKLAGTTYDANVQACNEAINEVVSGTPGTDLVIFRNFVNDTSQLSVDGIHPNALGGAELGKDIWDAVKGDIADDWYADSNLVPDINMAAGTALSSYGAAWQTGTGIVPEHWTDTWGHPQANATYGAGASSNEFVISNIASTDDGTGEGSRDTIQLEHVIDTSSVTGAGYLSGSMDVEIEGLQGNTFEFVDNIDIVKVGMTNVSAGYIGTSYSESGGQSYTGGLGSSSNIGKLKFKFGSVGVDIGHTVNLYISIRRKGVASIAPNLKVKFTNPRVFFIETP